MNSAALATLVAASVNTMTVVPALNAQRRFTPIKALDDFGSGFSIIVVPRRRSTTIAAKRKYRRIIGVDVVIQRITGDDEALIAAMEALADDIDNHLRRAVIAGVKWDESRSANDEPYVSSHLRDMGLSTAVLMIDFDFYIDD